MPIVSGRKTYFRLVITASLPCTEIWIGDNKGFPVCKGDGVLNEGLLPGTYTVEFGLGNTTYPITLTRDSECTQFQIEQGPSCPRPVINLDEMDD